MAWRSRAIGDDIVNTRFAAPEKVRDVLFPEERKKSAAVRLGMRPLFGDVRLSGNFTPPSRPSVRPESCTKSRCDVKQELRLEPLRCCTGVLHYSGDCAV
jgi:hypothetical protein